MTRSDMHRDAMLRQFEADSYGSPSGKATGVDHTSEQSTERAATAASSTASPHAHGREKQHHGRWHHRVKNVMTTSVVTVDKMTPYKEIAARMAKHKIGAVPVLILGRHVAGVVSEADLLSVLDKRVRDAQLEPGGRLHRHVGDKRHLALTAGELMTSPAITIHPDATLSAAARLMNSRHLKRLPVVDASTSIFGGNLIGIVSRCDLLSVFLRPDEDIAREVQEMLTQIPLADPAGVTVRVHNGVVTLAGHLGSAEQNDLIRIAVRLTWDIDGVVSVVNRLSPIESATPSAPAPSLPVNDTLPTPEEFVASTYDFTEQLLTSQRNFAENLIQAIKPVFGIKEGPGTKEGDAE